ncbi:LnmK family bifunctional acyltransferase/decarboxylase [Streptomyces sp. NPDC015171]|uniref:LnmK family bifunctional acyltransferase/decarboxylase n=1 Tax=Streptomyces sp. NPDC015171 TaxID=3364945 RepID=UPI0036F715CE
MWTWTSTGTSFVVAGWDAIPRRPRAVGAGTRIVVSDVLAPPDVVLPFCHVERTGPASVRRTVVVQPGMCGPLQNLVACVGDWTWQTVSMVCGLDVFNARDARGLPSYLAFYYYRLTSGSRFRPRDLTFGERVEVESRVFHSGRLSVVTVHRIRRIAGERQAPLPFDADEPYGRPRPDCLYVENLNVWVARSDPRSNVALVRTAPIGFTPAHLPDADSPRDLCARARDLGAFPDPERSHWTRSAPDLVLEHPVDVVRDVNGVGLLYFAAFFPIAERAQLHQWRASGGSDRAFLDRTLLDARICYFGNADLDATLALALSTSHDPDDPAHQKSDLAISDAGTGRTIAVAAFRHRDPARDARTRRIAAYE